MPRQSLTATTGGIANNNAWQPLIARILLVVVFTAAGFGKISGYDGTAHYMAMNGIPLVPVALPVTIAVEIGASVLIIIGYQTRWAALALAAFTLAASLIFHQFWAVPAEQVQLQTVMFLKNLGLIGGLLLLANWGPGRLSLDSRMAAKDNA